MKRAVDFLLSAIGLIVLAPVFLVAAIAIKLDSRGPVFFKQRRIGKHLKPFNMLKFRTMVVDAEARLAALEQENQRKGPLFKLDVDPRVTRIGRFLRASSLDELPQLINVIKGEMSLVGPRPALPAEVAEFPIELRERHRVRPGITGLWQVEARDNPSFDAYQRLDLFYVENWSLALDLVVMLGTAEQLLLRPVFNRRTGEMGVAGGRDAAAA
jgi:lipopolysaccharide/colanic/teichoic acid biosynthesis glycosyltransferase